MTLPGNEVYRDGATSIWYCYAQGMWHYSIDTCQTWVDVPMLDIRIVEGTGTVDTFGPNLWVHGLGADLEFFDSRYAQSGWHNMTNEFVVEYYDGVGYDGEPLKVVDVAITDEQSESAVWLNHLVQTGGNSETPSPDATIDEWLMYVYGQWDKKLVASARVPHPDADWRPWENAEPLNVVCEASDIGNPGHDNTTDARYQIFQQNAGANVIVITYKSYGYRLSQLVGDLTEISECFKKESKLDQESAKYEIKNLAIINNGETTTTFLREGARFRVGISTVTPDNLVAMNGSDPRNYRGTFKRLDSVMVDASQGGQIQYFGCNVAGPNPDKLPKAQQGTTPDPNEAILKERAIEARQMLAAIANLTNTTVFASSDRNNIIADAEWCEYGLIRYWAGVGSDLCLEFGIDPWGRSVSYSECSSEPWNLEMWQPKGVTLDATHGLQSMYDLPYSNDKNWPWHVNGDDAKTSRESEIRKYGYLPLYEA